MNRDAKKRYERDVPPPLKTLKHFQGMEQLEGPNRDATRVRDDPHNSERDR